MHVSKSPFKVGFAALVAPSLVATAAVQLSSNTELFVTADTAVRYDDNIYQADSDTKEDVIFQVSPGLELTSGKEGANQGRIAVREDFIRYVDEGDNDAELFTLQADGKIVTPKSSLEVGGYFKQLQGNTQDFLGSRYGDLVRRDTWQGNGRLETEVTPKVSASVGGRVGETDYDSTLFADQLLSAIPLNVYYKLTPKLDLSAGYEWRDTSLGERFVPTGLFDTDGNEILTEITTAGSNNHFFNVGARGEIAPKLSTNIRVGVDMRKDRASDNDSTTLGVDGGLFWAYSAKTQANLQLGRRFETSAIAQALTRTTASLGVTHQLSGQFASQAEVRYEMSDYELGGRTDHYYEFTIGSTYAWTDYLTLAAGYAFRFNNSDLDEVEFTNNVFSISARWRY